MRAILILFLGAYGLIRCSAPQINDQSASQAAEKINAGSSCQQRSTRQGYLTPMTSGDVPCARGMQTCTSGIWRGPPLYEFCDNYTKNCGASLHGTVVTGYLQSSTPKGIPCTPATKTCLDGNWSGPEVYPSCVELP
jgi:hypothetical protein